MKFNSLKRRRGFSLIEVNMAIFVLAGGALALLGLFPLGLRESQAARNEMRVIAFAERFLGAARIAATMPDIETVDDFIHELEGLGFQKVMSDAGTTDDLRDPAEDRSGVFYRAWAQEKEGARSTDEKLIVEVGVRVTAENAKQNKRALNSAATYMVQVFIDTANVN